MCGGGRREGFSECEYVCMYVYVLTYLYVSICMYMYACIYTHTHTYLVLRVADDGGGQVVEGRHVSHALGTCIDT